MAMRAPSAGDVYANTHYARCIRQRPNDVKMECDEGSLEQLAGAEIQTLGDVLERGLLARVTEVLVLALRRGHTGVNHQLRALLHECLTST